MSLGRLGGKSVGDDQNRPETAVQDDDVASLLWNILKELKLMNLHMAVLTDQKFTKEDING